MTHASLGVPHDILYRASYAPLCPCSAIKAEHDRRPLWVETGLVGPSSPPFLLSSLRGVVISLSVALLEHHNAYPTNDFKKGTLRLSRACSVPPGIQSYCQK